MLILYTALLVLGDNGYVPADELGYWLDNNAGYYRIEEKYPALMCAAPVDVNGNEFRMPAYPPTIVDTALESH